MNRDDLQRLSEMRLQEATALLAADLPEGAYYLAGYAIECALKSCIAKQTREHDFPDKRLVDKSYSHDLDRLLDAAGLADALKEQITKDVRLEAEWLLVRAWSEQSRYDVYRGDRSEMIEIARMMLSAVQSKNGGVLRWIKQHW